MRKLYISILSALILCLSCSEDDIQGPNSSEYIPNIKLPKKVTFSGAWNYSIYFYYNPDNTLNRIESDEVGDKSTILYYYENSILTRLEFQDSNGVFTGEYWEYIHSNGEYSEQINSPVDSVYRSRKKFFYSNNRLDKVQEFYRDETQYSYEYDLDYDVNGNVISRKQTPFGSSTAIQERIFGYDSMQHPYKNLEPKIFFIDNYFSFSNNPISETILNPQTNDTLFHGAVNPSYDADGFPVLINYDTSTITYEYY